MDDVLALQVEWTRKKAVWLQQQLQASRLLQESQQQEALRHSAVQDLTIVELFAKVDRLESFLAEVYGPAFADMLSAAPDASPDEAMNVLRASIAARQAKLQAVTAAFERSVSASTDGIRGHSRLFSVMTEDHAA